MCYLVFHRSRHGNGIRFVVTDSQGELAGLTDFNRVVDTSAGAVQIMECIVRINVTKIDAGRFGCVSTVVLDGVAFSRRKRLCNKGDTIRWKAVIQAAGYSRYYAIAGRRINICRLNRNKGASEQKHTSQKGADKLFALYSGYLLSKLFHR